MRKETFILRFIAIIVILYFTLIVYKYIKPPTKKPISTGEYVFHDVYSKPMTKKEIKEELGRSTWTLLHTIAAVYPGIPSTQHKKDVIQFIYLLAKLYPCGDCAQHFTKLIGEMPPKVNNHDEFATWMCNVHNVVNKRLGKEVFVCDRVDDRWECGCKG